MNSMGSTWILDARRQKSGRIKPMKSEQFLNLLLRSISDRICVLDQNGTVIYINHADGAFTPIPRNPLARLAVGANYVRAAENAVRRQIPHAEDWLRGVRSVLNREQVSFEFKYSPLGYGRTSMIMKAKSMPRKYGGVIIRFLEFASTHNSQEMQELSDKDLDLLANSAPVMVWRSGVDKACTYFNQNWLRYTGRTLEEELGEGWAEGVHPGDFDDVIQRYNDAFDARQEFVLEYRLRRADGRYGWILDRGVPTHGLDGTFSGYIGSCIDITSHKESLEALRESEERFRSLAEFAPIVIWKTDSNQRRTYVNEYWRKLTLNDPQSSLGFSWLEAVHQDDRMRVGATLAEATKLQQPFRAEYRIFRLDGSCRWCLDLGTPQFDHSGSYLGHIGTCIDITDSLELEKTRFEMESRMMAAQEEERKRIARELHDDISQRLVLCNLEVDEILKTNQGSRSRIAKLYRRIQAIASDIYRISHNLHPSTLAHLGLVPALRRLSKDFADHKGIVVKVRDDDAPAQISQQAAIVIFRIAQECLNNIAKHSGSRSATLSLKGVSNGVQLTISDSGSGFDTTRLDKSPRGLGITNIRERLRMVQGNLEIKSKRGRGTKVVVWVPVKKYKQLPWPEFTCSLPGEPQSRGAVLE